MSNCRNSRSVQRFQNYVFAMLILAEPQDNIPSLDSYELQFPIGDPLHLNYGISDFWWEASTTKGLPWWEKMNVSITPARGEEDLSRETTLETEPDTELSIESLTNETVIQTATVSLEESSPGTISTTEIFPVSTSTMQDTDFPLPAVYDADLLAQLRVQQGSNAAIISSPQDLASDKLPLDYNYYGELHNRIPQNVRGPENQGLLRDIPVILQGTNNKTDVAQEKSPPSIPGWRLLFPDRNAKTDERSDKVPALMSEGAEKTTKFNINYADYLDEVNDGMKLEPLPDKDAFALQPGSSTNGFESKDQPKINKAPDSYPEKSTVVSGFSSKKPDQAAAPETSDMNNVRSYDYPSFQDIPVIPESIHESLGTTAYSPVAFKFDETREMRTQQVSRPGIEGMFKQPATLKAVSALSPTYAVHAPSTETAATLLTTQLTIPPASLPWLYEATADWITFSTNTALEKQLSTTDHPLIATLKKEMKDQGTGYYSVCLRKFFEIFSKKEDNDLTALLKGSSKAFERMNENDELMGLGRPMWPGTELGFLQMRLAPIHVVKSKARSVYKFYSSGPLSYDVTNLHDRLDVLYHTKDGEYLMNSLAAFQDFPGENNDMNAEKVMEDIFRSVLAPYFRDKTSPKVRSVLKDINEKLEIASEHFFSIGRRNTKAGQYAIYTSNKNINNKKENVDDNNEIIKGDNDYDSVDRSEKIINNFGDNGTINNIVVENVGTNQAKTINDNSSYEYKAKTEKTKTSVIIGRKNKKTMDSKNNDYDTYERKSKAKNKGLMNKNNKYSTTDLGNRDKTFEKLNCLNNNEDCSDTHTTAEPKRDSRSKYFKNEVKYRNSDSKMRPLKDIRDKTRNKIDHKEKKINYNIKNKVTEATNFYHNVQTKKYPGGNKIPKKATKNTLVRDNTISKNGETNNKKWYLNIFKYNNSITYDEKDYKINYNSSNANKQRISNSVSGTSEDKFKLQTKAIKSKTYSKIKASSRNFDFSYSYRTNNTFNYGNYDDNTESKNDKEHKINISQKSGLSKNKGDDYDTSNNSTNSNEVRHCKGTYKENKEETNKKINLNAKRNVFQHRIKAQDYIKELRIGRTTIEKEQFREFNRYYKTASGSHVKTLNHQKLDKKHMTNQNHKIWTNVKKINLTQTTATNIIKKDVPRYENKDWNAARTKNIDNSNSEYSVNSYANEIKKKYQEINIKHRDNQFDAKEFETKAENTKKQGNGKSKLSEGLLQNRIKQKQYPEYTKNYEINHNFEQTPIVQYVYSVAPVQISKPKYQGVKNKKEINIKDLKNNKNKPLYNKSIKKFWQNSKSQYVAKDADPYLKERFLDFNRDNSKTKTKFMFRNLGKNKNILRDESSYSDEEELLKSNLQDNILHGGRTFTDILHKYEKSTANGVISSYSDEENTLKKNIYKLLT